MFWTRLLPFLNQPNWALRLRTIYTKTTALTQKGCVGCVNNGEGGNTCGPHGFLYVQRAIGGVLSAFDYWCQLGTVHVLYPTTTCFTIIQAFKKQRLIFWSICYSLPNHTSRVADHSGLRVYLDRTYFAETENLLLKLL